MNIWKFYDITHREHTLCNPLGIEKLDRLTQLLRLTAGARVLDIASGKGEFLIRLAETYGISGTGVDISPFVVEEARERLAERTPDADITFVEMDGAAYLAEAGTGFELASCIGASWIFKGLTSAGLSVGQIAWLYVPVMGLWGFGAWRLGRIYSRLREQVKDER